MSVEEQNRNRRLYGRRVGKPLSPFRTAIFAEHFPRLAIDPAGPRVADLAALFPGKPVRIRLEIGFGGGEHLMAQAAAAPDTGFIGIEPFVNGLAKAVHTAVEGGLENIRFYGGDGAELLDWLPDASVDEVDLLYPDPWRKTRHWKRRFVREENLARLARVLKPDGRFRVASDVPDYIAWTLQLVPAHEAFVWLDDGADCTVPYPGWPGTRYEEKAIREGRTPQYLTFARR